MFLIQCHILIVFRNMINPILIGLVLTRNIVNIGNNLRVVYLLHLMIVVRCTSINHNAVFPSNFLKHSSKVFIQYV